MTNKGGIEQFDVIVVGSGSAGFTAAETARSLGASVCLIEKGKWGGECPNYACIPTKTLIASAKKYYEAKEYLVDYGVYAGSVKFSFKEIMQRKDRVIKTVTGGGRRILHAAEELGIVTIKGAAVFEDQHTVRVGSRKIFGKSIVLAAGATDVVPPIHGIDGIRFLTYRDVAQLKRKPSSVAIIGGGPVGCEYASFFGMLETNTHLFEMEDHVLPREDEEMAVIVQNEIKELGVAIHTRTVVLSVEKVGKRIRVTYESKGGVRESVMVDEVMVAVGKRANIDELHIEAAKLKVTNGGYLDVTSTLQTSVKHIFAAGDIAGGMRFTHTANNEGVIAGTNAVAASKRQMLKRDERVIPRVIFAVSEMASVGISSKEAVMKGIDFWVAKFPVGALGRAVIDGERRGLVKMIVDKKSRKILGGSIVSGCAGEMIHEIALAMELHATIDDIVGMTHAFPTYSEGILAAAASI